MERFKGKENPYPQMEAGINQWHRLMKEGRPVSETVDNILSVIKSSNPNFWNYTDERVGKNIKEVYRDPSGRRFLEGSFVSKTNKVNVFGEAQSRDLKSDEKALSANPIFQSRL